jgi:hypothetical protein
LERNTVKKEELEAMTKDELREHAEVAGVKLGALDTKGTMVEKILGEYVAPAKESDKKKSLPPEEKLSPLGRLCTIDGKPVSGRKMKLKIYATEQDKSDVDIIVNGHNIRVQRNQDVIVDEAYVEALQHAVIQTMQQDPDTGEMSPQEIMVYPHTAVPV